MKDLLSRQNMHNIQMNKLLYEDKKYFLDECENPKQEPCLSKHVDLLCAAHCLCRSEYKFYKRIRESSVNKLRLDANADDSFTVTSNQPGFDPLVFQSHTA